LRDVVYSKPTNAQIVCPDGYKKLACERLLVKKFNLLELRKQQLGKPLSEEAC